MRRIAVIACVMLAATSLLQAKAKTLRLDISGGSLSAPIQITDTGVQQFNVWEGPGVNGTGLRDGRGFIAEWQAGVVATPPAAASHFEVAFYVGCCLESAPALAYRVSYAFDPVQRRGYVYIPGRGDAVYAMNSRSIFRGPDVEGHWFRTTQAWDRFVAPYLPTVR